MKCAGCRVLGLLGLLVAVIAGAPSGASAYSINKTERGRSIRWSGSKVSLQVDPAIGELLPEGQVDAAIAMSLDAWRGFEGVPDFELVQGAPGPRGHREGGASNAIYLPAKWDHEPDKLAITVVTYEMASGRLLDADVIVNPDIAFALLPDEEQHVGAQTYDLGAVLTHEMGHVLGLGESEEDPMATMWPYADRGDTHQRTLSEDDEAGIIDAYDGPPPLPAASCGPMTVAGHRAPPSWLVCGAFGIAGWLALRSASSRRKRVVMAGGVALIALGGGGAHTYEAHDSSRHLGAVPSAFVTLSDPAAQLRISRAFSDASVWRVGAAERLQTRDVDGLFVTDYEVVTVDGERVQLSVAGGERDGIGQRVGEGELPSDGAELMVAADGKRFAFHSEGLVWGGSMGEGPAIQLR